ncbi:MAG: hypothetical protein WCJ75_03000 [Desulfomonile sp.]
MPVAEIRVGLTSRWRRWTTPEALSFDSSEGIPPTRYFLMHAGGCWLCAVQANRGTGGRHSRPKGVAVTSRRGLVRSKKGPIPVGTHTYPGKMAREPVLGSSFDPLAGDSVPERSQNRYRKVDRGFWNSTSPFLEQVLVSNWLICTTTIRVPTRKTDSEKIGTHIFGHAFPGHQCNFNYYLGELYIQFQS